MFDRLEAVPAWANVGPKARNFDLRKKDRLGHRQFRRPIGFCELDALVAGLRSDHPQEPRVRLRNRGCPGSNWVIQATDEERQARKQLLLKGPVEFRDIRGDLSVAELIGYEVRTLCLVLMPQLGQT